MLRSVTVTVISALVLFAAGCGKGQGTETTPTQPAESQQPAAAVDPGCEDAPRQPMRVNPVVTWRTLVTVCQSRDGTSMYVRNDSSAVLVIRTTGSTSAAFQTDANESASIGDMAVAAALGRFSAVAGGVRVASQGAAVATATTGVISANFEVDPEATVAAAAATSFIKLAERQIGSPQTSIVQQVAQCADDTASLFDKAAYLEDYFRRAVNDYQSCKTLYATTLVAGSAKEATATEDALAADAAEQAKGAWIDELGVSLARLASHR